MSALPLPASVAHRGTLFGGALDCFVLDGGMPVVIAGRAASLETRALVDRLLALAPPIHFEHDSQAFVGVEAEAIVDSLMAVRADRNTDPRQDGLAREWLRQLVSHGLFGVSP